MAVWPKQKIIIKSKIKSEREKKKKAARDRDKYIFGCYNVRDFIIFIIRKSFFTIGLILFNTTHI